MLVLVHILLSITNERCSVGSHTFIFLTKLTELTRVVKNRSLKRPAKRDKGKTTRIEAKKRRRWLRVTTSWLPDKLEPYASPPLSPPTHWTIGIDPVRRGSSWDRLSGMDGDNRRIKHHDPSSFPSRSGVGRRSVARPVAGATDRFRQSTLQPTRGDPSDLSHATGRARMPTYADYGYTDTPFQGGSLQPEELQPYVPDFARQQQTLREQQRQQQVQQQFASYEPEMVYHLNQPGHAPYEVVPPYPARQSAAIEALSSQFAVPQYFSPTEPTGTGVPAVVSPYLTPQLPSGVYNQPGPIGRSSTAQHFPATMTDFTTVAATARLEQQSPPQQQHHMAAASECMNLNLGEAYNQFEQALRGTFDHSRSGRLVEANRSLLEISEWLVANARELGKSVVLVMITVSCLP